METFESAANHNNRKVLKKLCVFAHVLIAIYTFKALLIAIKTTASTTKVSSIDSCETFNFSNQT